MRIAAFCLIVAAALPVPLLAQAKVPADRAEIGLSFAPVVKAAAPTVVNIYASRIVAQRLSPFADDPLFSQFFDFGPSVPRVQNSLGSGVILRADGIVVSNFHVVGGAEDIRVVLADRREYAGRVILADEAADLAVIRLDGAEDLPALDLADSDLAEVGDLVLAIGNPFGVGQTVTSGIVSGLARAGGDMGRGRGYFIQTDAAINPGNSGGALVDTAGRLLGINTSILTRSGGSHGIGFAIPSNLVAQYVAQAEAGAADFARPWSGIEVQPVDAGMAEALGLAAPGGVVIRQIHPESPFAKAGLDAGDVVTGIAGHPVDGPQELDYRLAILGPGGTADLRYWSDGDEAETEIVLSPAPDPDAEQSLRLGSGSPLNGLAVAALGPALIERLGLPLSAEGVVVTEVAGPSRRTRLRPGDILIAVNGLPIRVPEDLAAATAQPARLWQIEFLRGGRRAMVRLSGG
ncbi:trypsin-like peptidase domain-containing protein [Defluviimonas sp. WL0024]|uniref:Trypsin-like peptidase domain-containing protein n=1 Tax=Albidovulum salinarum TaxID=2984153 RepID=A0ABT2X607_9RHOB|nr:trypsin-like peptidase domain-containing protein [Defluviimonas sp. WL0024]MCU9849050.1 trypsin-like peptidase domain-containing protein [Defluviimonas sp. WL0024]